MTLNPTELAEQAAASMLEKRATGVRILDLQNLSGLVDYFVIGSADSEPQIKAIVEQVTEDLKDARITPWHIEGTKGWRWVLIDYVDVAVHIFREEIRAFYGLERLWGDAPITEAVIDPETGQVNYVREHAIREETMNEQS